MASSIKALFLDVGGVLMTNGWDRNLRRRVAEIFSIEEEEMAERHALVFDTFETGKLNFDEYLKRVIFYKKRNFTIGDVKKFAFEAVRPFTEMIAYVQELKKKYKLKIGVISNEGRELAEDRIQRFNLSEFVDFFIISSFVHFRKPDADIYRLALDVAQVKATEVIYIDDRALLITIAKDLGIFGIQYTSFENIKKNIEEILEKK
jgi:putative hydrolase of the HAD superfamily